MPKKAKIIKIFIIHSLTAGIVIFSSFHTSSVKPKNLHTKYTDFLNIVYTKKKYIKCRKNSLDHNPPFKLQGNACHPTFSFTDVPQSRLFFVCVCQAQSFRLSAICSDSLKIHPICIRSSLRILDSAAHTCMNKNPCHSDLLK